MTRAGEGFIGREGWDSVRSEGASTLIGRVARDSLKEAVRFGVAAFFVENGWRLFFGVVHPALLLTPSFRWATRLAWIGVFWGVARSTFTETLNPRRP